jgi:hypothetical protein
MTAHRKIAEDAARAWAKHAHSETYVDPLHPKAMEWLIGAIQGAIEKAARLQYAAADKCQSVTVETPKKRAAR